MATLITQSSINTSNLIVSPLVIAALNEDASIDGFNNLGSGSNTYLNTWTTTARLVNGQGGDDTITTGGGNDVIYGGSGKDTIKTGEGNDKLYGGSGEDILFSGADQDKLFGGSGNDQLYSGAGSDEMTGGTGNDRFSVSAFDSGVDVIHDFTHGEDVLSLSVGMSMKFQVNGSDTLNFVLGQNLIVGSDPHSTIADDTFLFDSHTGMLSYDADGIGSGAAVDLVVLEGVTSLTNADFSGLLIA
jgi:Ca2+-binding RTX toxin-like protein